MRLALPQDVLVGFVESDSSSRGQLEEILIVDGVERRMSFQEVGNAIVDGGGFHVGAIVHPRGSRTVAAGLSWSSRSQTGMSELVEDLYNQRDGCPHGAAERIATVRATARRAVF